MECRGSCGRPRCLGQGVCVNSAGFVPPLWRRGASVRPATTSAEYDRKSYDRRAGLHMAQLRAPMAAPLLRPSALTPTRPRKSPGSQRDGAARETPRTAPFALGALEGAPNDYCNFAVVRNTSVAPVAVTVPAGAGNGIDAFSVPAKVTWFAELNRFAAMASPVGGRVAVAGDESVPPVLPFSFQTKTSGAVVPWRDGRGRRGGAGRWSPSVLNAPVTTTSPYESTATPFTRRRLGAAEALRPDGRKRRPLNFATQASELPALVSVVAPKVTLPTNWPPAMTLPDGVHGDALAAGTVRRHLARPAEHGRGDGGAGGAVELRHPEVLPVGAARAGEGRGRSAEVQRGTGGRADGPDVAVVVDGDRVALLVEGAGAEYCDAPELRRRPT